MSNVSGALHWQPAGGPWASLKWARKGPILFSLWCKKVALRMKEKTLKQNMVRSKCLNIFLSQISLYEEFLVVICHSSLYFAILTSLNEL